MYTNVLNKLLEDACPSIKYRVRTEIFSEAADSKQCQALQQEILKDALVCDALSWQSLDGTFTWYGSNTSFYNAARILYEKAVAPASDCCKRMLDLLDYQHCGPLVGRAVFDSQRQFLPTAEAIVHRYFALDETENDRDIQNWSVGLFKSVAAINDLDEVISYGKNGSVFKTGFLWPDQHDLELVGLGTSWRTEENQAAMKDAIQKMIDLFPGPDKNIKGKYRKYDAKHWSSYSISYSKICPYLPKQPHGWNRYWFKTFEMISRMPFLHTLPAINIIAGGLADHLSQNDGWFTGEVDLKLWNTWACYSGLALETVKDKKQSYWPSDKNRIYDVTFRCLIILNNFGMLPVNQKI